MNWKAINRQMDGKIDVHLLILSCVSLGENQSILVYGDNSSVVLQPLKMSMKVSLLHSAKE